MIRHVVPIVNHHAGGVVLTRCLRMRVVCWRFLVTIVLANLCAISCVQADEEDDDVPVAAGERQYVVTAQAFDQMVFGGQRSTSVRVVNGVQRVDVVAQSGTEVDFRKRMGATVAIEIQALDRHITLTESQKKKLLLAGRGDVERVVSRAAELRPKLTSKPMTQQQYTELMRELQPLRIFQQYGIIGESSLFQKTLRRLLTNEQRVRFQTLERDRRFAIVDAALKLWDRTANGVKLTGESRRIFIELILEQGQLPQTVGPYGQYIVLLEADRLREEVKSVIPEAEWQKFETQVGIAKRIEPTLVLYGLWNAHPNDEEDLSDEAKE